MATKDTPNKISISDGPAEPEASEVKVTPESPIQEPTTAPELDTPLEVPEVHEDQPDPETDKAVDEIAAQEGDDILAAEDEKIASAFTDKKPGLRTRLRKAWSAWWHNPLKRRLSLAAITLTLAAIVVVPTSRYFVLNTAGVRSKASLVVIDNSTQQPLKNVEVKLGDKTTTTDKEGKAVFNNLRLGKTKLTVYKRAFAVDERSVTIGWGSNPLKPLALKPTGSQYSFIVTDYLSGKPIENVEAITGEASAVSNEQGEIKLTIDPRDDEQTAEVTFGADDYRVENISLDLNATEEIKLELVPDKSHLFVSKRSGRYDVYKIDADGKNEEKVLAGSGVERDDLVLVTHPTKDFAALVSTRENVRNDGFLLSTLTFIDIAAKTPTKIAQSERVQIVDWIGDRLVYVQIASGASASDPQRHRLMSYDMASGSTKELAGSNYFNDVLIVGGNVYYAPSAAYATSQPAFYRIAADGSGRQTVLDQEVWNVFRTGYNKLVLAVGQDWYEYDLGTSKTSRLSGEPANLTSRVYTDSLNRKQSLWVDQRDGKGVLLAYDLDSQQDTVLQEQSGLRNPVQWLNDSVVVFRVNTSDETADYVMSLNGGDPKKLQDVTNTSGVDRWYYY